MRHASSAAALLIASLVFSACGGSKAPQEKAMNVLFIVVDDLNKTLGCYDHPVVQTPNLDRLASEGIVFDQAHCNFPICGPSRASFLTGLRPETTTILGNRAPLSSIPVDWLSLPALFQDNGYHTVSLGKIFHDLSPEQIDHAAWDDYHVFPNTEPDLPGESRNLSGDQLAWCWWKAVDGGDEDQQDGQMAQKAVEFLRSEREKPFFLAVGLHKPHDPYVAPSTYFDLYPLEACDPPSVPESWEPPHPLTLTPWAEIFREFGEQEQREFLRAYYACCSYMDAQVGKILQALEESGESDNTLIVFFGDHGYHLGEHRWWNKVTLFELSTAAPFLMAGPPVEEAGGQRSRAMFEFIDIYPTLAELCQLEGVPANLDGESFAKLLENPELTFRSEVRALVGRGEVLGHSVKNEQWRYVEWDGGRQGSELYDQVNDPMEYHNLSDSPEFSPVVQEMKVLLQAQKQVNKP